MLELLDQAEQYLPDLLAQAGLWGTLHVTYEYPHVERLVREWRPFPSFRNMRLMLHRIAPPPPTVEPLWHPHPWPSAVHVLAPGAVDWYRDPQAEYEMGVGRGPNRNFDVVTRTRGELRYAMVDPGAWHYVRPRGESASYSIMITDTPYPKVTEDRPHVQHALLTPDRARDLHALWTRYAKQ